MKFLHRDRVYSGQRRARRPLSTQTGSPRGPATSVDLELRCRDRPAEQVTLADTASFGLEEICLGLGVSTPSASTRRPSVWPKAITAQAMTPLPRSAGSPATNEWSILSSRTANRLRVAKDE